MPQLEKAQVRKKDPAQPKIKVGLNLNIQKTKIRASGPIISWEIDGETVSDYILGLQNHCRW